MSFHFLTAKLGKHALFIGIFLSIGISAFSQSWLWAKSASGNSEDRGNCVSTDASGNVFITGKFSSPSITFGTTTLTNASTGLQPDIFIVKYDPSGNILWAKSAGGTGDDAGWGVSTDTSGNVFVVGSFNSPSITFGTTILTNSASYSYDIFIVKYDASGNLLWAQASTGINNDLGWAVCTDASGNVYMTGGFQYSITFGTITLTSANAVSMEVFIVKYDAAGNALWAKIANGIGSYNDFGYSISTDAGGNVYMTGLFQSPSISFETTTLTNMGNGNIFIVKYDDSGNLLWAQSAGGTTGDWGTGVSADANGDVYLTGYFGSPSVTFGTTTLTNAGSYDIIIVKYNASGNILWAKSAGGAGADYSYSASSDASGNVYLTGSFQNSITLGTTTLTNTGSYEDIFIAKYDNSGNVLCAKSTGAASSDVANSVSADASGNAFVTGAFASPSIAFGTTILANTGSYYDIFLAKWTCGGNILTANVSHSNLLCNGLCTGIATVTPAGGTGPYTYNWSNSQTTQTITGLCMGTYTVTITDAANITTTGTATITQPTIITGSVNTTATSCGSTTGTATVTASGGTGSLSYLWSGGGTATSINNIGVGTYTVTITDSLACTQTATGTVVSSGGPIADAGTNVTIISGASTQLNASGGIAYSWAPSNGLSCTTCANPIASPSSTTDYCVTVTDINNCSDSACVRVGVLIETNCPTTTDNFTMPTAFSPNNDGHNDLLILHGLENCFSTFSFVIFDRWGEKVFETEDVTKGWNGIFNGKHMDAAVFVYYINAVLISGEKISKKGNISLIR